MLAPEKFVEWLAHHSQRDELGYTYNYHPRSDSHSKALAGFIWEDLLETCPAVRKDKEKGLIDSRINFPYRWLNTHKAKTIDLAIGTVTPSGTIGRVRISCELKTVMTEHSKSKPRVFDELSSSYQIVHAGDQHAIAAGLTVINIADCFVSPLRQRVGSELYITKHRQPDVAKNMVEHLRGLLIAEAAGQAGFDAYSSFVVSCDNRGKAALWREEPAPQPGDKDHYVTFLECVCKCYTSRFG